MLIKEIIMVALKAIRANAMRSILTTLGIIIGVGAVIAMVAMGEGAQQTVEDQIERMGTNILTIRPGQGFSFGVRGGSARLYLDDAEALRDNAEGITAISPEVSGRQQIAYLRWNSSNEVKGTWPEYFEINNMSVAIGRTFNQGEVQGRRRVVMLGADVPEQLETPAELLVGQSVQIRGISFEVIGVLNAKGDVGFSSPDDDVYIPVTTAMYRVLGGRDYLSSIFALTPTSSQTDQDFAFAEIDRILRREHRILPGEDADFNIRNSTDFLATAQETSQTFTLLLAGIAGVSLIVGGIGIMNIMLVSVTERTREIGVRKALGATRRNIMFQFLVEALFLCIMGGIIGVLVGYGSADLMTRYGGLVTAVSPNATIIALGFSGFIGLFFGIWPARRAARLDPIDALRYE